MVPRLSSAASRLRSGCLAACAALLLAACGGGGDDGRHLTPGERPLQGSWVLEVTVDGVTTAPVDVAAEDVPDEEDAEELDRADLAGIVGATLYQGGYTVSVSGNTVRVVDPDSDYLLTIDSVSSTNFVDCGACGVGSTVRLDVRFTFTESGVLDGVRQSGSGSETLRLTYRRVL